MRILVNDLAATGAKTGIGHYTAQLLRCMRAQAPGDAIESYPGRWLGKMRFLGRRLRAGVRGESGKKPGEGVKPPAATPADGWRAACARQSRSLIRTLLAHGFTWRSRLAHFDLYHEPNNIPLPSDIPTVATLLDLSVLLHPQWHPAYRVAEYEARFRKGLSQCRHFLAISEFARQELIQTLGLRAEQVTRTYMGVRPGMAPMAAADVQPVLHHLGLPPKYFLYLGTIEPRKNLMTLLRAYIRLPAAVRERYPLVLAGGWGWNSADVAAFLDAEARHQGVVYTGYVPEEHLAAVLNGARALVYPSFYEGFGLPPVEMMACGGAVLCSTAGALVETVGARAHLVEALDEDGWRAGLLRAAVDDEWIAELRRGTVETARAFTWERCAEDTLAVYRAVCGGAAARRAA